MEELKKQLAEWLQKEYPNGIEIYADYRDEMQPETAKIILENEDPFAKLKELLWEWYDEVEYEEHKAVLKEFLKSQNIKYEDFNEIREELMDTMYENMYIKYPEDHYLSQKFDVDIFLDTGDVEYDLSVNEIYPHYNSRGEEKIQDIKEENCLLWLARKQGYNKRQFYNYFYKDKLPEGKKSPLLSSMYQELYNCTSHCNQLCIFKKMTLKELIELKESKEPLKITKDYTLGLVDTWCGAGGLLDIELEKDFMLPRENIQSIEIDDTVQCYSVKSIYADAWMYEDKPPFNRYSKKKAA